MVQKVPENLETVEFQKKWTIQQKILGGKSNGPVIPGKKFCKNFGIPVPLKTVLFSRNSRTWCSIHNWKFLEMRTGILVKWKVPEDQTIIIIFKVEIQTKYYLV